MGYVLVELSKTPIRLQELIKALITMSSDKALNLDDFSYKFYKATYDYAKLTLLEAYYEILSISALGEKINYKSMKEIPKGVNKELISS